MVADVEHAEREVDLANLAPEKYDIFNYILHDKCRT